MAEVFQLITTDINNKWHEDALIDGTWHVDYSYDGTRRTLCGVQLDGDDGIGPGPSRKGRVTCILCRGVIQQIKAIKNW